MCLQTRSAQGQSDAADISDIIGSEAQKKVDDRIQHALENEQQQREQIGEKVGRILQNEGRSRDITINGKSFKNSPARHPLLANDGADPQGKSKQEYTEKDTDTIFHDETFTQCLEDRQVFNPDYLSQCAQACPGNRGWVKLEKGCRPCDPEKEPDCVMNEYYVSELYFPVYVTRTYPGRAMGSFDPNGSYLSGQDKRPDLKLTATKQRLANVGKQTAEQILQQHLGKDPKSISEKLYPDWYDPSVEWYGHDGDQAMNPNAPFSFHSLTYQTNAHRQATRRRPQPDFHGYELQDQCFFHTLDNPNKDVIAGASYGKEEFIRASMSAKESENIDAQGAKATVLSGSPNIFTSIKSLKANGKQLPQELQGLRPSQSMAEWTWTKQGLQRIGVKPQGLQKDYVFYGHELTPYSSSRDNSFVDPFYAAVSHGFSHYMLSSLPEFSGNTASRRALRYSYHTARGSRPNYSGEDPVIKENIIFTDKMQIIFPPWKDGGKRRGSHCFRPETIARVEPGEKEGDLARRTGRTTSPYSNHFNLPLEIRKRFPEKGNLEDGLAYANEVRIAYYIKRVNCYCTKCGTPYGCSVLNNGDYKEDSFYGETPLAQSEPQLFLGGTTTPSNRVSRRARAISKIRISNMQKKAQHNSSRRSNDRGNTF